MPAITTSVTESRRSGARIVAAGIAVILALLAAVAGWLFWTLPDAGAFDARVERLFIENDDLASQAEVKLLEILAQSGTAFSDTLASYRTVIFVLLVFAAAMLIAAIVFLVLLVGLNRRMAQIERSGIEVTSLTLARAENMVYLNTMGFRLSDSLMETLAVLAEARLDGEMLTGAQIEAMITGKPESDCDEAAGTTRIKRLRDGLGNQLVSELLVRNVARRGYVLSVDRTVIAME